MFRVMREEILNKYINMGPKFRSENFEFVKLDKSS